MARSYSARITALITGVQPKWLDNLLSRHDLPGIARSHQGVERRISDDGVLAVELCRILNIELGVSLARAAAIVDHCMEGPVDTELRYATESGLLVSLSVQETRARLRERTMEAIDMVAITPRGRPRLRQR